MEQTLALLKKELKREEYQPLVEELNKYEKYTERKMVKKRLWLFFQKMNKKLRKCS